MDLEKMVPFLVLGIIVVVALVSFIRGNTTSNNPLGNQVFEGGFADSDCIQYCQLGFTNCLHRGNTEQKCYGSTKRCYVKCEENTE